MYLTDMNPTGSNQNGGLFKLAENLAVNNIFTTFVGVGLDFNSELVEYLTTNVKGSSYSSIKNARHFMKHMDKDFDYMFAGLLFNMSVQLKSDDFEIETVYGSRESNQATGELMKTATTFPSSRNEKEETQGGVILLKLLPKKPNFFSEAKETPEMIKEYSVQLDLSFEDINQQKFMDSQIVKIKPREPNFFEGTAIRKAILLTHHTSLLKLIVTDKSITRERFEWLNKFKAHFEKRNGFVGR